MKTNQPNFEIGVFYIASNHDWWTATFSILFLFKSACKIKANLTHYRPAMPSGNRIKYFRGSF